MLTLDTYLNFAKRTITKFATRYYGLTVARSLLKDDDVIGTIATAIMTGDWKWDGRGSRQGYRTQCAIWAIHSCVRYRTTHQMLNGIDFNNISHRQLTPLDIMIQKEAPKRMERWCRLAHLTPLQKECVMLYYYYGHTMKQIANQHQISIQAVSGIVGRAKTKLKQVVHEHTT